MKSKINFNIVKSLMLLIVAGLFFGCAKDDSNLKPAAYSTDPNVFIDAFSSNLIYAAFGGSVVTSFQVDKQVTYNNSSASMRFDVPNYNDPSGAYAGGSFFTSVARDLSGYDALTFWAKATQTGSINVIGFGNDFGANAYQASVSGLQLSTYWKKYIIPIPDPSKLKMEKGMLFVSEGPENNNGYTFWLDDVKFEKLGTIAHTQASILNGANTVQTSFVGVTKQIDGLTTTFNLPNGVNQAVNITANYLVFSSSNPSVATVNANGLVTTVGAGTAVITATLAGQTALGSLTINSNGVFTHAPTPTNDPTKVISIYTDTYPNITVDYYNGYWQPYQTTTSADFSVAGDNVLNYNNFNFVGIQFSAPVINATTMTSIHVDLYLPNPIAAGSSLQLKLTDFGSDGIYGGSTDYTGTYTIPSSLITSQNWISLNIPLTSFAGLTSRAHLAQLVFVGTNVTNFYADNIYLFKP